METNVGGTISLFESVRASGLMPTVVVACSSAEYGLVAVGAAVVVPNGWDHEHCELCNAHIDPGGTGYVDHSDHWVCAGCYTKYVAVHDLSFLYD